MTCAYLVEGTGQMCGHLARWLVVIEGEAMYLCTIHKLTMTHRDPSLEVRQA